MSSPNGRKAPVPFLRTALALLLTSVSVTPGLADEKGGTTLETPAPVPVTTDWHVLALSSYAYNFNRPDTGLNALRVFDRRHRTWQVDLVSASLVRPAAPLGFQVDLVTGDDAVLIASQGAWKPEVIDFKQAFVSWKPGGRSLELRAGKFVTTAGYESIPAFDALNTQLSQSYLFGYAIPFAHTGVRALFPVGAKVNVTAGVNRGWDKLRDNNGSASFELAVAATLTPRLSLTVDTHHGPEQEDDGRDQRHLYDMILAFRPSARLTLAINADIASEDGASTLRTGQSAHWAGVAGYLTYAASKQVTVSARLEEFHDPHGARTGASQTLREGDLTVDWSPHPNLTARFGLRFDESTSRPFTDRNSPSKRQASAGMALVIKR